MTLRDALIQSGRATEKTVDKKIESMKARVRKGADPEKLLYAIGLEPDYVIDLLF